MPILPPKDERDDALRASGNTSYDLENLALQLLQGILAGLEFTVDDAGGADAAGRELPKPVFKFFGNAFQAHTDIRKGREGSGADGLAKLRKKRNPWFEVHNIGADVDSPVTQRYLVNRRWKKVGGGVTQGIGDLLGLAAPPANVAGAVYHGQAAALTGLHMMGLGAIAREYREAWKVREWLTLIYFVKTLKLSVRGSQAVSSALSSVVPLANVPVAIVAALAKAGIKHLTVLGACYAAAAEIQWIAYQEQGRLRDSSQAVTEASTLPAPSAAMTRPGPGRPVNFSRPFQPTGGAVPQHPGAVAAPPNSSRRPNVLVKRTRPPPSPEDAGPASKIIWEIFTKRGATWLLGPYDIPALISEPAGWMALGDKLTLI